MAGDFKTMIERSISHEFQWLHLLNIAPSVAATNLVQFEVDALILM